MHEDSSVTGLADRSMIGSCAKHSRWVTFLFARRLNIRCASLIISEITARLRKNGLTALDARDYRAFLHSFKETIP